MGTFRRLLDIAPLPRARGTGGDGRGACAETQDAAVPVGMVGSHRVGGEFWKLAPWRVGRIKTCQSVACETQQSDLSPSCSELPPQEPGR